ncbi:hypothetical protein EVAR_102116_1 [Eumeta japonica]|uniref:Uncharacterized protein n=1 Tax=Eumeta variegata TaxID=151549 RepID=A0A4C1U044_EUMVA|nr:hypothetical protein EVAR_102116_1 [Eumeta japonica]
MSMIRHALGQFFDTASNDGMADRSKALFSIHQSLRTLSLQSHRGGQTIDYTNVLSAPTYCRTPGSSGRYDGTKGGNNGFPALTITYPAYNINARIIRIPRARC